MMKLTTEIVKTQDHMKKILGEAVYRASIARIFERVESLSETEKIPVGTILTLFAADENSPEEVRLLCFCALGE